MNKNNNKTKNISKTSIMELLCIESETEPIALFDPNIVDDDRTLTNLIFTEEHYLITGSYFKCLQTDLTTNNRTELASWMLEVCLSSSLCYVICLPACVSVLFDISLSIKSIFISNFFSLHSSLSSLNLIKKNSSDIFYFKSFFFNFLFLFWNFNFEKKSGLRSRTMSKRNISIGNEYIRSFFSIG